MEWRLNFKPGAKVTPTQRVRECRGYSLIKKTISCEGQTYAIFIERVWQKMKVPDEINEQRDQYVKGGGD